MNSKQYAKFRVLLDAAHEAGHIFTYHKRFINSYRVSCSCGWRREQRANQNAMARVAKLDAAVREHANTVTN